MPRNSSRIGSTTKQRRLRTQPIAFFGAQNLIRDYFYGFVILVENQFKLNDVVKIGDVSGQVEGITLRMTVLRDPQGATFSATAFVPENKDVGRDAA